MQPTTLTKDEQEEIGKKRNIEIVDERKVLPVRGTYLVLDGMPMVVLSKSDKQGTLHLKRLTDREIALYIQRQQKLTDEDLAKMATGGMETE